MDISAGLGIFLIICAFFAVAFLIFSVIMVVAISWTHSQKGRKKK